MSTAPDPGMTCPDCGRVFATFGNVTNMPCTACAYRRLDAQAMRIHRLEAALRDIGASHNWNRSGQWRADPPLMTLIRNNLTPTTTDTK